MMAVDERIKQLMGDPRIVSTLLLYDPDTGEQIPGSDAIGSHVFLGVLAFREGLKWHNYWVSHVPPDDLELSVSLFWELQRIREALVSEMLRHHPPQIVWSLTGFERTN